VTQSEKAEAKKITEKILPQGTPEQKEFVKAVAETEAQSPGIAAKILKGVWSATKGVGGYLAEPFKSQIMDAGVADALHGIKNRSARGGVMSIKDTPPVRTPGMTPGMPFPKRKKRRTNLFAEDLAGSIRIAMSEGDHAKVKKLQTFAQERLSFQMATSNKATISGTKQKDDFLFAEPYQISIRKYMNEERKIEEQIRTFNTDMRDDQDELESISDRMRKLKSQAERARRENRMSDVSSYENEIKNLKSQAEDIGSSMSGMMQRIEVLDDRMDKVKQKISALNKAGRTIKLVNKNIVDARKKKASLEAIIKDRQGKIDRINRDIVAENDSGEMNRNVRRAKVSELKRERAPFLTEMRSLKGRLTTQKNREARSLEMKKGLASGDIDKIKLIHSEISRKAGHRKMSFYKKIGIVQVEDIKEIRDKADKLVDKFATLKGEREVAEKKDVPGIDRQIVKILKQLGDLGKKSELLESTFRRERMQVALRKPNVRWDTDVKLALRGVKKRLHAAGQLVRQAFRGWKKNLRSEFDEGSNLNFDADQEFERIETFRENLENEISRTKRSIMRNLSQIKHMRREIKRTHPKRGTVMTRGKPEARSSVLKTNLRELEKDYTKLDRLVDRSKILGRALSRAANQKFLDRRDQLEDLQEKVRRNPKDKALKQRLKQLKKIARKDSGLIAKTKNEFLGMFDILIDVSKFALTQLFPLPFGLNPAVSSVMNLAKMVISKLRGGGYRFAEDKRKYPITFDEYGDKLYLSVTPVRFQFDAVNKTNDPLIFSYHPVARFATAKSGKKVNLQGCTAKGSKKNSLIAKDTENCKAKVSAAGGGRVAEGTDEEKPKKAKTVFQTVRDLVPDENQLSNEEIERILDMGTLSEPMKKVLQSRGVEDPGALKGISEAVGSGAKKAEVKKKEKPVEDSLQQESIEKQVKAGIKDKVDLNTIREQLVEEHPEKMVDAAIKNVIKREKNIKGLAKQARVMIGKGKNLKDVNASLKKQGADSTLANAAVRRVGKALGKVEKRVAEMVDKGENLPDIAEKLRGERVPEELVNAATSKISKASKKTDDSIAEYLEKQRKREERAESLGKKKPEPEPKPEPKPEEKTEEEKGEKVKKELGLTDKLTPEERTERYENVMSVANEDDMSNIIGEDVPKLKEYNVETVGKAFEVIGNNAIKLREKFSKNLDNLRIDKSQRDNAKLQVDQAIMEANKILKAKIIDDADKSETMTREQAKALRKKFGSVGGAAFTVGEKAIEKERRRNLIRRAGMANPGFERGLKNPNNPSDLDMERAVKILHGGMRVGTIFDSKVAAALKDKDRGALKRVFEKYPGLKTNPYLSSQKQKYSMLTRVPGPLAIENIIKRAARTGASVDGLMKKTAWIAGSLAWNGFKRLGKELFERPITLLDSVAQIRKGAPDTLLGWFFREDWFPENRRRAILKGEFDKKTWLELLKKKWGLRRGIDFQEGKILTNHDEAKRLLSLMKKVKKDFETSKDAEHVKMRKRQYYILKNQLVQIIELVFRSAAEEVIKKAYVNEFEREREKVQPKSESKPEKPKEMQESDEGMAELDKMAMEHDCDFQCDKCQKFVECMEFQTEVIGSNLHKILEEVRKVLQEQFDDVSKVRKRKKNYKEKFLVVVKKSPTESRTFAVVADLKGKVSFTKKATPEERREITKVVREEFEKLRQGLAEQKKADDEAGFITFGNELESLRRDARGGDAGAINRLLNALGRRGDHNAEQLVRGHKRYQILKDENRKIKKIFPGEVLRYGQGSTFGKKAYDSAVEFHSNAQSLKYQMHSGLLGLGRATISRALAGRDVGALSLYGLSADDKVPSASRVKNIISDANKVFNLAEKYRANAESIRVYDSKVRRKLNFDANTQQSSPKLNQEAGLITFGDEAGFELINRGSKEGTIAQKKANALIKQAFDYRDKIDMYLRDADSFADKANDGMDDVHTLEKKNRKLGERIALLRNSDDAKKRLAILNRQHGERERMIKRLKKKIGKWGKEAVRLYQKSKDLDKNLKGIARRIKIWERKAEKAGTWDVMKEKDTWADTKLKDISSLLVLPAKKLDQMLSDLRITLGFSDASTPNLTSAAKKFLNQRIKGATFARHIGDREYPRLHRRVTSTMHRISKRYGIPAGASFPKAFRDFAQKKDDDKIWTGFTTWEGLYKQLNEMGSELVKKAHKILSEAGMQFKYESSRGSQDDFTSHQLSKIGRASWSVLNNNLPKHLSLKSPAVKKSGDKVTITIWDLRGKIGPRKAKRLGRSQRRATIGGFVQIPSSGLFILEPPPGESSVTFSNRSARFIRRMVQDVINNARWKQVEGKFAEPEYDEQAVIRDAEKHLNIVRKLAERLEGLSLKLGRGDDRQIRAEVHELERKFKVRYKYLFGENPESGRDDYTEIYPLDKSNRTIIGQLMRGNVFPDTSLDMSEGEDLEFGVFRNMKLFLSRFTKPGQIVHQIREMSNDIAKWENELFEADMREHRMLNTPGKAREALQARVARDEAEKSVKILKDAKRQLQGKLVGLRKTGRKYEASRMAYFKLDRVNRKLSSEYDKLLARDEDVTRLDNEYDSLLARINDTKNEFNIAAKKKNFMAVRDLDSALEVLYKRQEVLFNLLESSIDPKLKPSIKRLHKQITQNNHDLDRLQNKIKSLALNLA